MTISTAHYTPVMLPRPQQLVRLIKSKLSEGGNANDLLAQGIDFTDAEFLQLHGFPSQATSVNDVKIPDIKAELTELLKSDKSFRSAYLAALDIGERLNQGTDSSKISIQSLSDPKVIARILNISPEDSEAKNIAEGVRLSIQGVKDTTRDDLVAAAQVLAQGAEDRILNKFIEAAQDAFDASVGSAMNENLNIFTPEQSIAHVTILFEGCKTTGEACERLIPVLDKIQGKKTYAEKAQVLKEHLAELKSNGKVPESIDKDTLDSYEKYLGEVAISGVVKDLKLKKGEDVKVFIPAAFQGVQQGHLDVVNKKQGNEIMLSLGKDGHVYGKLMTDEAKEIEFTVPYLQNGSLEGVKITVPKALNFWEKALALFNNPISGIASAIVGVFGGVWGAKSKNPFGWLLALLGAAGTIPAIIKAFSGEKKPAEATS